MPYKPGRACRYQLCKEIVKSKSGYCDTHERQVKKQYDQQRESSAARGYGSNWQKLRKMKLQADPMCECPDCKGQRYSADMVHHIIPIEERPDLRLSWDNLASYKKNPCHELKHKAGRFGNH